MLEIKFRMFADREVEGYAVTLDGPDRAAPSGGGGQP
jgi:hypothetical protein